MNSLRNLSFTNKMQFLILLCFGVILSAIYGVSVNFDNDIAQLLARAHHFLSTGILTPYGSIASSGVKVFTPGSFLSAAISWPMALWDHPFAALIAVSLFHLAGLLLVVTVLLKYFDFKMVLLYVVFYWCSPWRTSEVFLWNPTYMFFWVPLHFWSAERNSEKPDFIASAIHIISIFGAMQSHSSFVALVILSFLLLWKKAIRLSWGGSFCGVLLGGLSLLPYFLEKIHHPEVFQMGETPTPFLFRGIILVYPFLKGIWYWIRQGSFVFPSHLLNHSPFSGIVQKFWMVIVQGIGFATVYFSIRYNLVFAKENKLSFKFWDYKISDASNWVSFYLMMSFWALLAVSAIIPAEMSYWHVLLFYPLAVLVPLTVLYDKWQNVAFASRVQKIVLFSLMYFVVFTVATAYKSAKHQWPGNLNEKYLEQKLKPIR